MQHKLSVVQVIDILNTGGAERVLINLANLLHAHGHVVKVVTTVRPGPLASQLHKGIVLQNLHRSWKWNPLTMYKLAKAVREYDVIHVHSSYNLRYLFLTATVFRIKKPIFFHEHFGDININQLVSWHTKFIYPKTMLIAVSRQIATWAIEKVHVPRKNVFVLPNTVMQQSHEPLPAPVNEIKKLLIVSNIRPSKNILFGIQVLQELLTKGLPVDLTIIGQVADKHYNNEIDEYIKVHQLGSNVLIKTNETNVQSLLYEYDLALHTAISESGPLVLIEYMAQGLPFITYNTGEVVQQVKDDLPECIMYNFDIENWIDRIRVLLKKDKHAWQLKLQNVFEKYYSAEAYYEQCIQIYQEGLNQIKQQLQVNEDPT